jgi:hypothetical protein
MARSTRALSVFGFGHRKELPPIAAVLENHAALERKAVRENYLSRIEELLGFTFALRR